MVKYPAPRVTRASSDPPIQRSDLCVIGLEGRLHIASTAQTLLCPEGPEEKLLATPDNPQLGREPWYFANMMGIVKIPY